MRVILGKVKYYILALLAIILCIPTITLSLSMSNAFAENEKGNNVKETQEFNHVTIYDGETKLSVKTDAKTVKEVLERANITISESDIVDPSLDTLINADNFFINIYRARPVLVIDGLARKYMMTASHDLKEIAASAGFSVFDGDIVETVENSQFLELGNVSVYEVKHGNGSTITIEEEVPFTEETVKDYALGSGKTEVVQYGEVGKKSITYSVKTQNGVEVSRELVSETVLKEPVPRIEKVGADPIEMNPLSVSKGRNYYTVTKPDGSVIERQETYYDLNMSSVMGMCGKSGYSVREDGAKIDDEGYVIVAANLNRYPRCSIVQTSLGLGKVYDTGGFASVNPEQFDLATDWSTRDGI